MTTMIVNEPAIMLTYAEQRHERAKQVEKNARKALREAAKNLELARRARINTYRELKKARDANA